jgi:hypothetical protein
LAITSRWAGVRTLSFNYARTLLDDVVVTMSVVGVDHGEGVGW